MVEGFLIVWRWGDKIELFVQNQNFDRVIGMWERKQEGFIIRKGKMVKIGIFFWFFECKY